MQSKNSEEAFVRNLTACQSPLYSFILSLLPDCNAADDVLQDVNLVMWRRAEEFVEGTNFMGWACQIARFKVLAYHRDQGRNRHVFDDQLLGTLAAEAEHRAVESDGDISLLDECVDELPLSQRELVHERYSPGGSVQVIAARLGKSVSNISVTLSRIRQTLMDCMHRKMDERAKR
jgi:RNA polymerase sigma-70 factor, ECF subfamily